MQRIQYYIVKEDDKYRSLVNCPYGKRNSGGIIKVGSIACQRCEHFNRDIVSVGQVECKADEEEL